MKQTQSTRRARVF